MKHYPIDFIDTMNACRDDSVRNAGAGIALLILIVGGILLIGPIAYCLFCLFWADFWPFLIIPIICAVFNHFSKK